MSTSRYLSHSDYTVGWICALPLEMAAAKAMLDENHPDLGNLHPSDHNAYTLGSIRRHNVVIACLPSGVYGTTSAAIVASHMLSSFPSIKIPLMVGIGGGVPSKEHDIRLGDVVVGIPTSESAAVVQYDLGKTVSPGVLEPKGTLNKPAALLLTAVSKIRANHDLGPSKVPEILSTTFTKNPRMKNEYAYPGQDRDFLYRSGCDHVEDGQTCDTCGSAISSRQPRSDDNPKVHYGPIASENQVMKHSRTRDRLAQQFGIPCFEMEAAGLMDSFQCLVIRGICDYCDAQKQKDFQKYAALAAAAYTTELLWEIPPRHTLASLPDDSKTVQKHRKHIMDSLHVDGSEVRQVIIKDAHVETCEWLLHQSEYRDWLDDSKFSRNHGFLWIKGKPGTGKSTLMKFTLAHIERTMSSDIVRISFFFNARGHAIERSTIGAYKSLLFQLLEKLPRLQHLLDALSLPAAPNEWNPEVLKATFRSAVEDLKCRHLVCFVDALDECPEDQARDMVEFVESLCQTAASKIMPLHICFSSRHYPHISIGVGLQLILDDQEGHANDITSYVASRLKIRKTKQAQDIKDQVIGKASGIFLWVVLVVHILNKEYDSGKIHKLQKRLQELPTRLDELFTDLLMRDTENPEVLLLCLQWILYAQRPLRREEFYFAMLSGQDPLSLTAWDPEEVTLQDMERLVLSSSKGLVEVTQPSKDYEPTLQFIHESVREFLLKPDALVDLWPGFSGISRALTHVQLRDCCYNYMGIVPMPLVENYDQHMTIDKKFPFCYYAVSSVLHHANVAEECGNAQLAFLENFNLDLWKALYSLGSYSDPL